MAAGDGLRSADEVVLDVSTGATGYDGTADLHQPLLWEKNAPWGQKRRHKMVEGVVVDAKRPAPVDTTIESLDYEVIENSRLSADWRSAPTADTLQYLLAKWVLVFLLGLITALVGYGLNMAIENVCGFKFLVTLHFMNSDRQFLAFFIYLGSGLVMAGTSAAMVVYLAPAAAGSGVAEVKAYLNGIDYPEVFATRTLIVKIVGAVLSNSAGMALGKEGPLMHIGSIIASILGQGGSTKYRLKWKVLRFFNNDRDRRDLVTCGIAAGVATAFRAPIGGVIFAFEEAASWWRNPLLWRAFFTTATVAVTLRTCIKWCANGACGLFGDGGLILFDMSDFDGDYGLQELLPVAALGVLGGFLGSLFNKLNLDLVATTKRFFHAWKRPSLQVAQALLVACVTAVCGFCLPWLAACRPCPPGPESGSTCPTVGRVGNYKAFACPAGHYNDLAGLLFNTNDDAIRNLFSVRTRAEFAYSSLALYSVTMYALGVVTYGVPVPSGLYIPEILAGAAYGRAAGMLMGSWYGPGRLDEGVYAVLGAASMLGGSMRMTAALLLILLELTNNLTMLPLIMLVLIVSKTIGDYFNRGIFVSHVLLKGLHHMDAAPGAPFLRRLQARDAAAGSKPLVTLARVERVGRVYDVLWDTYHNGIPVLDHVGGAGGRQVLTGLVLRQQLLVLLRKKAFQAGPDAVADTAVGDEAILCSLALGKPGSGKGLRIEDIRLTPEERDLYVDLYPVCNTSPYTVVETMALSKTYTLFRQLGLRHLCVLPATPQDTPITGILTRKDFDTERLLKQYPHLRDKYPGECSASLPIPEYAPLVQLQSLEELQLGANSSS